MSARALAIVPIMFLHLSPIAAGGEYPPPDAAPRVDAERALKLVGTYAAREGEQGAYVGRMVLIGGEAEDERLRVVWVAKPGKGYHIFQVDMKSEVGPAGKRWIVKASG